MNDGIKLFTIIKPKIIRDQLFKSVILSSLGIFLLFFSGIFLPNKFLSLFGIPILLIGGTLITVGMLPYKKLNRLETNPNEIFYTDTYLEYRENRKPIVTVLKNAIKEIDYEENKESYGIKVYLNNLEKDIIYHQKKITIQKDEKGKYLFFKYFPLRAFTRMKI